jgi:hypothetical protein
MLALDTDSRVSHGTCQYTVFINSCNSISELCTDLSLVHTHSNTSNDAYTLCTHSYTMVQLLPVSVQQSVQHQHSTHAA